MRKSFFHSMMIVMLIILFVYTGSSKLLDISGFVSSMERQPFGAWINKMLAYSLPVLEIIIAAGMVFERTRIISLYGYIFLMLGFTVYTGLVVFGFFEREPCGCGGIMSKLSWTGHLIVNFIFTLLSILALVLTKDIMHKQGVSRKPVRE